MDKKYPENDLPVEFPPSLCVLAAKNVLVRPWLGFHMVGSNNDGATVVNHHNFEKVATEYNKTGIYEYDQPQYTYITITGSIAAKSISKPSAREVW